MTSNELIDSVLERMARLDDRVRSVFAGLGDDQMNQPGPPSDWSPAQILEHMMITNAPYLVSIQSARENAPLAEVSDARHGAFGRILLKAASPEGNVPAPKELHPTPGRHERKVVDDYLAQTAEACRLVELYRGVDLGRTKMQNPFLKVFRMTMADTFEVLAQHTERHVGQIEAMVRSRN